MHIEDLRLLAEVAQHGSFAAVARHRGLDPSTVSRTITALERELGARLFQRTPRKLSLTEAGTIYSTHLRNALTELDQAREEALHFTTTPTGTLRITTSAALGHMLLVPLLPLWRETFPSLVLDLLLTDTTIDIIAERVDLAIRVGARPESGMVGARLLSSRFRACASPAYLRKKAAPKSPLDLMMHNCVLLQCPSVRPPWRFRSQRGDDIRVDITGSIMISSALSVRQAALDGVGPTLLPDWLVAADVNSGALVDLFPLHEVSTTGADAAAWLVYPTRTHLPRKVRVFIDFIKTQLEMNPCG